MPTTGATGPAVRPPPPVAELDGAVEDDFVQALAPLFENAPRFLRRLAAARPFGTPERLFSRAREIARGMTEEEKRELIDAHPRLGAPPATVSRLSFGEQGYDKRGQADREAAELQRELDGLNEAYEARFGFRYCVFVAGRGRQALVPEMRAALDADRDAELARALDAVIDIAADRYRTLTTGVVR